MDRKRNIDYVSGCPLTEWSRNNTELYYFSGMSQIILWSLLSKQIKGCTPSNKGTSSNDSIKTI